jgi:hypothetical protein
VSFLLDQFTRPPPARRYAGTIDLRRISMTGHYIGGYATARTMDCRPRISTGIDLDGTLLAPDPEHSLGGRPCLMLGAQNLHIPNGPDGPDGPDAT